MLGTNDLGGVGRFLADKEVQYWGEPVALVVAESHRAAREAAQLLDVKYAPLPAVKTLHEAIALQSEHPWTSRVPQRIESGEPDAAFAEAERVVEGDIFLGASEHFYMEPHSSLAVPEERSLRVVATTQSLAAVVDHVAAITGKAHAQIAVQCKRLGGGFGGKGLPLLALPALAAVRTGRPCKMTLTREQDMVLSTKRAETLLRWKAAVKGGLLHALQVEVFYAAGYFKNMCDEYVGLIGIAGMASYEIPHFRALLHCMQLNRAPTGPMRGAGIPQGGLTLETVGCFLWRCACA